MSLLTFFNPSLDTSTVTSITNAITMDEVAVYNRALTPDEVRQHFQTAKAIPGRYYNIIVDDTPVAYWRLSENGTVAYDAVGSYNGTYEASTDAKVTHMREGALGLGADNSEAYNTVALYFRDLALDEQTQLDINGVTQAELTSAGVQPDYGIAKYNPREMADLDLETQSSLNDDTQFDLERLPDYLSEAWLEVKLKWSGNTAGGQASGTLSIQTANGDGYLFEDLELGGPSAPLYVMFVELKDTSIRVRVYQTDDAGNLTGPGLPNLVFDSTEINDPDIIKRRKGRFGWWAQFADGDAYVQNIRTRGLSFGEAVTKEFESNTPVAGAALVVGATPDRELFTGAGASPWGGAVFSDPNKTKSGKALRVTSIGGRPLQGLQTNSFRIEDLANTNISFDVLFPSSSQGAGSGLEAFLYGEYARLVPLNLGAFQADRWQHIDINLTDSLLQTGKYRLIIVQSLPFLDTTWFVDNISIKSRSVTWEARGHRPDPWGMAGDQWVPLNNTVNKREGGVLFEERGKGLQVRATAKRQDAQISEIKVVPKYAELGRFRWTDEIRPKGVGPTASIPDPSGADPERPILLDAAEREYKFSGFASTAGDSQIIAYHWTFGDGVEDYGSEVTHKYLLAGTYLVTLTVIDAQHQQSSFSREITVA